jgi:hypothetical protein
MWKSILKTHCSGANHGPLHAKRRENILFNKGRESILDSSARSLSIASQTQQSRQDGFTQQREPDVRCVEPPSEERRHKRSQSRRVREKADCWHTKVVSCIQSRSGEEVSHESHWTGLSRT